jgi:predicted nuclease with RNAse H fold
LTWYGADPGGTNSFGVAALEDDGSFKTWLCSSVDEALTKIVRPSGVGIDCPLWWSSGAGGGRFADSWLRKTYRISPGTVQSANSLKGAVLIQGIMLAMMLRRSYPKVSITESHPKALLLALGLRDWKAISNRFGLDGPNPTAEHERDALIGAVAAREGSLRRWKLDLSHHLGPSEIDPRATWFGKVHYWWPAETLGNSARVSPKPIASADYGFTPTASSEVDLKLCPECQHGVDPVLWTPLKLIF